MKIGILTYHYACNFGANLQVLSTVGYLRREGHTPVVIDWRPEGVEELYRRNTPDEQARVHRAYVAAHLPVSASCRTPQDIANVIRREAIDAVVVGSDAVVTLSPKFDRLGFSGRKLRFVVTKPVSVNVIPNPFWGAFLEYSEPGVPCAMMSVSSQNTRYRLMSRRQRLQARQCLERFAYVSVRDTWTRSMMHWISDGARDPDVTPDPVFSFNQNVDPRLTGREVIEGFRLPEKYILVSFKREHCPPEHWVRSFAQRAEARGYACVALPYPQGLNAMSLARKIDLPLTPLQWYALIKYSAGYVGHNMHPIVSCIHNCVPFYSFDNYGYLTLKIFPNAKSSKIYDLLRATNMLDRRCGVVRRAPSYPAPEHVLDKLANFDRSACAETSAHMQLRYAAMMNGILQSLGAGVRPVAHPRASGSM